MDRPFAPEETGPRESFWQTAIHFVRSGSKDSGAGHLPVEAKEAELDRQMTLDSLRLAATANLRGLKLGGCSRKRTAFADPLRPGPTQVSLIATCCGIFSVEMTVPRAQHNTDASSDQTE